MQLVPVAAVPNQSLQCQVGGQNTTIDLVQSAYGLFMTIAVNGTQIIGGVICLNLNRIVRSAYLGFLGDFVWLDSQGTSDPSYQGLGTRYQLIYLEESDLPAGES
jgi:hypothetical protein